MPHEVELIATIAIGFAPGICVWLRSTSVRSASVGWLSHRGSVHRPINAGFRGRSRDRRTARRDRCDSAHVRRRPSFYRSRPDGGAPDCGSGCDRPDHYRHGYRREHDNTVGLELWSGFGPRVIFVGCEHRGHAFSTSR